jgi:hypothetical protein
MDSPFVGSIFYLGYGVFFFHTWIIYRYLGWLWSDIRLHFARVSLIIRVFRWDLLRGSSYNDESVVMSGVLRASKLSENSYIFCNSIYLSWEMQIWVSYHFSSSPICFIRFWSIIILFWFPNQWSLIFYIWIIDYDNDNGGDGWDIFLIDVSSRLV